MEERTGLVTMRGNPVTLAGHALKVGDMAPDFEVTGNDMKPVKFSSFSGKVCVISWFRLLIRRCATWRREASTRKPRDSVRMLSFLQSAWICRLPRKDGAGLPEWKR